MVEVTRGDAIIDDYYVCSGGRANLPLLALRAFRRIPVPTPTLHIQPVKGRTLVNLRTNFYATGGEPFTRTVTLLGRQVTLRIHVEHYEFRFGDGESLTTAEPGAAYPSLTNTHTYRRKGVVRASLVTTWAANYRVGGGAWRPVDGTVITTAPPQTLTVVTATPLLTPSG